MKTPWQQIAEFDAYRRRYMKDAEGHEHGADGKFTGTGGGGSAAAEKKPKKKKTKKERVEEGRRIFGENESKNAHEASERAHASGKRKDHIEARVLHDKAEAVHNFLGNSAAAEGHRSASKIHDDIAFPRK